MRLAMSSSSAAQAAQLALLPSGASKDEEQRLLSAAMNRPQDNGSTFVTGGDVSRFQRSTMPRTSGASAAGGDGGAPAAFAVPTGPIVRVTRGKDTTVETVGRGAGAMLDRQAQGVGSFGRVSGAGLSTLR